MGKVDARGSPFQDFTMRAYRETLALALSKYPFRSFADVPGARYALWRHDVDFSIAAALKIAKIEADLGARSTYFVLLSSSAYNALSSPSLAMLKEIVAHGHWIGLHYDAALDGVSTIGVLNDRLSEQRMLLESRLGTSVSAFSFHNPTAQVSQFDAATYGGMVNAYSKQIRESTLYCSDSNGVWRYANLHELVRHASADRIHILTHPEWWARRAGSARKRLFEALAEDRLQVLREYNLEREAHARPNEFELDDAFASMARTESAWALAAQMIWLQGPPSTAFLHVWGRTRKKLRLVVIVQVRRRFGIKIANLRNALRDKAILDRVDELFLQDPGEAPCNDAAEMMRIFGDCEALALKLLTGVHVPSILLQQGVKHCTLWLERTSADLRRGRTRAAESRARVPRPGGALSLLLNHCAMRIGDASDCANTSDEHPGRVTP